MLTILCVDDDPIMHTHKKRLFDHIIGFEAQGSQVRMDLVDGSHNLKLSLSNILS